MKRKACAKCRIIVNGNKCPICQGDKFSENVKGKLVVLDPARSEIAKKSGINAKGEYAIKVQ